MKNHRILIFFVVVLFALTLAACERKASTPPPDEGPAATAIDSTQSPMDELGMFATQTAQALLPNNGSGDDNNAPPSGGGEAPTATPVPPPPPPPEPTQAPPVGEYPVPDHYTLQKGEFPYCIARRFNISPSALLAANGLSNGSVTYPGQTLTIPKGAGPFDAGPRALHPHPATYTIRAGDTVHSIACLFGDVDPRAIEDANGLEGAYTLPVGGTLQIP